MKQLSRKDHKKFFKKLPKRDKEIVLVLENIEYARNVASIFRTADASGVREVFLTGATKTPPFSKSLRLVSRRKEKNVQWSYAKDPLEVIKALQKKGYLIVAVEVTDESVALEDFPSLIGSKEKICFVLGSEKNGVRKYTLEACDHGVFIPMYGKGNSLNVAVSAAVVLYTV